MRAEAQNLQLNSHITQDKLEDFTWFDKTAYIHRKRATIHILNLFQV